MQNRYRLYVLRYKRGMSQVQTGFLEASSLKRAEDLGRAYCNSVPGCKYISVYTAILADESFLEPDTATPAARAS